MLVTKGARRYRRRGRRWRHVPNLISLTRGLLGLILLFLLIMSPEILVGPESGWVALAFAIIFATDWVDGHIARKYNVTSKLGAALDTGVDKIIIVLPVFWLAWLGIISPDYVLGWTLAILTFLRELLISVVKPLARKRGVEMHVQPSGRFKMAAQCVAVIMTIWSATRGEWSLVLFGGAVVMGLYSLSDYYRVFSSHRHREVKAAQ